MKIKNRLGSSVLVLTAVKNTRGIPSMLSGAEIWMLVNADIHLDLKIPLREDMGFKG